MEQIEKILNNGCSYKDVVIYTFIELYPLKTAKELAMIINCNYPRLTESLNILLDKKYIIKTEDYPPKYIKND